MDTQTAILILPKLESLRTFIKNVATAGQFLPDNATRANYRAIYSDIKSMLNDPILEIYAPPLPHLGTTSEDSKLWGEHQMRIIDSGTRLITYLDSQLMLLLPSEDNPSPTSSSISPQNFPPNINIENFQGILGNVEHSKVEQNFELLSVKGDFEYLRKCLSDLKVELSDIDELRVAIESDPFITEKTRFGQKVGAWIGKMIQKAATGAWDISINTAGNILAILIAKYYGFN